MIDVEEMNNIDTATVIELIGRAGYYILLKGNYCLNLVKCLTSISQRLIALCLRHIPPNSRATTAAMSNQTTGTLVFPIRQGRNLNGKLRVFLRSQCLKIFLIIPRLTGSK